MRIQFYPSQALENKLNHEARTKGVTVSTFVNEILEKHFGLISATSLPQSTIQKKIFDEISEYINTHKNSANREFDLNKASPTYRTIEMSYAGKPHILRASIGKAFNRTVGIGAFKNIRQVILKNGKPKRTVSNRAAVYEIIDTPSLNDTEAVDC